MARRLAAPAQHGMVLGRFRQHRDMAAGLKLIGRLIEREMAVYADTQHGEIDRIFGGQAPFHRRAFRLAVRRATIERPVALGWNGEGVD